MDSAEHWEILRELGEGGQGKVFLVRDTRNLQLSVLRANVIDAVRKMSSSTIPTDDYRERAFDAFRHAIQEIIDSQRPDNLAALKVLHKAQDARDPERAGERIRREIVAMSTVSHPNLLRVKELDPDGEWYVAEYHSNGVLASRLDVFKGDVPRALRAFRGLVAGVARLHSERMVHRDIKPENIFISAQRELILGDFGLVFFSDDRRTRLSATLENVGTRDWMPAWAMGMRVEDVKPTFDVFCLGKVLWAMVSGEAFLRLWYYDRDGFDVAKLFPQSPYMALANRLFAKCVVEREEHCLPNANDLLAEVDKTLIIIQRNGDLLDDNVERFCRVCGLGTYRLVPHHDVDNSGFRRPAAGRDLKLFTCDQCGHVQMFLIPDNTKKRLASWSEPQ